MNDNEHSAILGGGCIALIIAVLVAVVFMLASILDKI